MASVTSVEMEVGMSDSGEAQQRLVKRGRTRVTRGTTAAAPTPDKALEDSTSPSNSNDVDKDLDEGHEEERGRRRKRARQASVDSDDLGEAADGASSQAATTPSPTAVTPTTPAVAITAPVERNVSALADSEWRQIGEEITATKKTVEAVMRTKLGNQRKRIESLRLSVKEKEQASHLFKTKWIREKEQNEQLWKKVQTMQEKLVALTRPLARSVRTMSGPTGGN